MFLRAHEIMCIKTVGVFNKVPTEALLPAYKALPTHY